MLLSRTSLILWLYFDLPCCLLYDECCLVGYPLYSDYILICPAVSCMMNALLSPVWWMSRYCVRERTCILAAVQLVDVFPPSPWRRRGASRRRTWPLSSWWRREMVWLLWRWEKKIWTFSKIAAVEYSLLLGIKLFNILGDLRWELLNGISLILIG